MTAIQASSAQGAVVTDASFVIAISFEEAFSRDSIYEARN
jgi:hypothetical protein